MGADLLLPSSISGGAAAVRPPRPLPRIRPRAEEGGGVLPVVKCGRERGKRRPKQWEEWCRKLGGLNRFDEPVLRIVWSEDEMVLVGGLWSGWDDSGNWLGKEAGYRSIKKYIAIQERWVLEMWQPPEAFGSPEAWEREWRRLTPGGETYQLLPLFPSRGDYAQIGIFADRETGGYSEPTWDDLPGMYAAQVMWREKAPLERYYELRDGLEKGEMAVDAEVEAVAGQWVEETRVDVWKELGMRPRVSLAGLEIPGRRES